MRTISTEFELQNIEPRETVVYHRGLTLGLSILGHAAYRMYEKGELMLTQKRLSPPLNAQGDIDWRNGVSKDGFEYRATGV
jgi:hypothetical protein